MKAIDLGSCCADCFNAINFIPAEMDRESSMRAASAAYKLSHLADTEDLTSLHTGEVCGFSWSMCCGCGSTLGGERWELKGLIERKDIA